ncbi:hypothetical protein Psfp_02278 [Pelotomaculum sp. FP]|uniref:hypothetical protein n=1 Tax=Pelotomaculum sp. FP TaxID=261474 RepID=UPI001101EAD9|nr:hypothetical protein [Pelotomaculum sp. FP]TEB15241.1 hypothetical protein Psfp_02278 [Pelotomaculum sp. FP]
MFQSKIERMNLMAGKAESSIAPQDDVRIQEFLDMIAPSVIKFNTTSSAAIPIVAFGH